MFCDQVNGSTDFIGCYVPLIVNASITTTGDISCTNITNGNAIYSNLYLKNINAHTDSLLELFTNADINDDINIGGATSTTSLKGQATNVISPFNCYSTSTFTGLITSGGGLNLNNSTATNNTITNLYQMKFDLNYGNEK